jgi:transposase, IS5 family
MAKASKSRASKQRYTSTNQLILEGFETPFSQKLLSTNRWVVLSKVIPWDEIVGIYASRLHNSTTGAEGINPRVAIGAMIIKHMCDLSDRETVLQIQENVYMQYFIGYSSFSQDIPFDPSLFVEFRSRLSMEQINEINERIIRIKQEAQSIENKPSKEEDQNVEDREGNDPPDSIENSEVLEAKGKMLVDATACPQDIAYPTDLNVLNEAREKSEELIDVLYKIKSGKKPRTYRVKARKSYLKIAQKRTKSMKEIRKGLRQQLQFIKRNINNIDQLLDQYDRFPLNKYQHKYLFVIKTVYDQQLHMYQNHTHQVDHRIVSIHQPHVRPIVRGKLTAKVEFGAKIHVSLMQGYAFLDELNWDAFNEGTRLMQSVASYKRRFGYYPKEVAADKIYCSRENRAQLKLLGIQLKAKPLGRPSAVHNHISPGERNPIEGFFGQAKSTYGMNRIKAKLQKTSESWIATIIMVLNLVKLAGEVPYFLYRTIVEVALNLKTIFDCAYKLIFAENANPNLLMTYSASPN